MPRLMEGPGGDGPGREEAVTNGEGAVDIAAAAKEEAKAAKEMETGRCLRLSKMIRGRSHWGGMVPRSVEGPGVEGTGREEATADGEGAVDAAVAAKEEAEAAEEMEARHRPRLLKMTRGHGRGDRWGRG